jgi:DNA-directed RNA polymerase
MTAHTDEHLIDVQLRLESEMTKRGIDRYMRTVAEAKADGGEDKLAAAQTLMQHHTARLAQAIQDWLTETSQGRAGNNNVAYKHLKGLDVGMLAYVTQRKLLSRVSRPSALQNVARIIGTAVEDEVRLAAVRLKERKEYESILKGAKRRVSDHYKRVYAMRRASETVDLDQWPEVERMHIGMKLIDLAITTLGWFVVETFNVAKNKTQKNLVASPELVAQLDRHHSISAMLRPVFEPMVVQPKDWTNPHDGGYLSSDIRPLKLVKLGNKGYYEELEHTDMPVVYSSVNALQRTAWQINTPLLAVLTEHWERGHAQAGLPAREGNEIPPKPFDIETNEEARKKWRQEAAEVYQANTEERSKRIAVAFTLDVAGRYAEYQRIFMPYQLDFRGRIYAVPAFNPQGPDYMKALLNFSHGKPLGENGAQWLAMHGANVAGNDKCSLEERVQWVLDNEEEIVACATDPFANTGWRTEVGGVEIDKPWQFLAFAMEWKGYCEQGEAFVSKLAIALDGSCSGLQHFSAMLRDQVGGAAVNLVPGDRPSDVYSLVMEKVIVSVEAQAAPGPSPEGQDTAIFARQWLDFGIVRKTVKRSVMTLAYGSKQYGFKDQLLKDILKPALKKRNEGAGLFPFAESGYHAALFMAKEIWQAVTHTLVKSVEAMKWLQEAASLVSAEGLPIRWSSPVGFPVMQAYWDIRHRRIDTALQGSVIQVTMGQETDKMDRKKQANGISPNFVHSCDAAHMMLTTVRAEQEGIKSFAMIHDSFGTTAADTEDLFRIVRESFVEMYEGVDVLEQFQREIVSQLPANKVVDLPALPSRGTLDLQGVIASRFCFA